MNALDTAKPFNFIRDTVMGGNQALYDKTSMGVDIVFDIASGKALSNVKVLKSMNALMCKKGKVVEIMVWKTLK